MKRKLPETEIEYHHPMDGLISAAHTIMESFFDGMITSEVAKYALVVFNEEALFESPVDNGGRTQEALVLLEWGYEQVGKFNA